MKIYFCGSIRGGRDDAALYKRMIDLLKTYGDVLTEHVGDPSLTDKGGDGGSDYIWQRDTAWLRECDIVIAECTHTSLGVGYELGFAHCLGKPIHVFYRGEPERLSAMVAGDPAAVIHAYAEEAEAMAALRGIMEQ